MSARGRTTARAGVTAARSPTTTTSTARVSAPSPSPSPSPSTSPSSGQAAARTARTTTKTASVSAPTPTPTVSVGRPERVSVFDPSTESAFDPFGGLLAGVFGPPTEPTGVSTDPFRFIPEPEPEVSFIPEPEPEVLFVPELEEELELEIIPEEAACPVYCNIIHIPTGIISYEGMCSCSTIDRYNEDPNYRVDITTRQIEPEVELEP